MSKTRVGVLFGGRSGEHEVSLLSAASVLKAINKDKYEVVPIGISKEGRWLTAAHAERLLQGNSSTGEHPQSQLRAGDPAATSSAAVLAKGEAVIVPPVPQAHALMPFESPAKAGDGSIQVDVIFPFL
jgi:D-alanine-D-alanine ligase